MANVGLDLGVYVGLLALGSQIWVAKAIAFVCGTLFAFFANRMFTFRSSDRSLRMFFAVCGLYIVSLIVNVVLNSTFIELLGDDRFGKAVAYAGAVLPSAAVNFLGMKRLFGTKSLAKEDQ